MLKISNIIFIATTVVFAALFFNSKPAPKQTNIIQSKEVQSSSDTEKENRFLKQKISKLENELNLLKSTPERVVKIKDTSPEVDIETTDLSPGQDAFRKMMDEPEVKAMMQKRQQEMVMRRYGNIIDRLDLPEEDKEQLISLLGDRQLYRMQSYMRLRAATEETDKDNIKALQEEQNIDNENKIADLLGSKYDTYTDYQEKRREYEMLSDLNKKFEDNPLTEAQTDELATAMNTTASSFEFSNSEIGDNPMAIRELSKEDKEIYEKELKERDALVLNEVSDMLSDEQLKQLKDEQKRQRQRLTGSQRRGFPGSRRSK